MSLRNFGPRSRSQTTTSRLSNASVSCWSLSADPTIREPSAETSAAVEYCRPAGGASTWVVPFLQAKPRMSLGPTNPSPTTTEPFEDADVAVVSPPPRSMIEALPPLTFQTNARVFVPSDFEPKTVVPSLETPVAIEGVNPGSGMSVGAASLGLQKNASS